MGYLIEDLYGSDPIALIDRKSTITGEMVWDVVAEEVQLVNVLVGTLSESEYQEKLKEYEDNKQHQEMKKQALCQVKILNSWFIYLSL